VVSLRPANPELSLSKFKKVDPAMMWAAQFFDWKTAPARP
jgi:hypothetical protein